MNLGLEPTKVPVPNTEFVDISKNRLELVQVRLICYHVAFLIQVHTEKSQNLSEIRYGTSMAMKILWKTVTDIFASTVSPQPGLMDFNIDTLHFEPH